MSLELDMYSRFQETETTVFGGHEVFGRWKRPQLLQALRPNQVSYYKVLSNRAGRPDEISRDFYGTTLLDWLIIAYNDAVQVLNWPESGTVIKIPNRTVVFSELV